MGALSGHTRFLASVLLDSHGLGRTLESSHAEQGKEVLHCFRRYYSGRKEAILGFSRGTDSVQNTHMIIEECMR